MNSLTHMPCLSILQPWAWAIMAGIKCIENRSWGTAYKGPLLIHTGKSDRLLGAFDELRNGILQYMKDADLAGDEGAQRLLRRVYEMGDEPKDLPRGVILGVVTVDACVMAAAAVERWPDQRLFMDLDVPGTRCWHLVAPRRFATPVPYSGERGIMQVPIAGEVAVQLRGIGMGKVVDAAEGVTTETLRHGGGG